MLEPAAGATPEAATIDDALWEAKLVPAVERVIRAGYFSFAVEGGEHVPRDGRAVYAGNHAGWFPLDAFFVGLHLISANRADGIYLKNWCLNFLQFTEPDGQTPGGIRPWAGRDARLQHALHGR